MGAVCAGNKIPRKVLLTGLRNTGKTTLLYYWYLEKEVKTLPTESFNVELVQGPGARQLLIWDVTDPVRRRQFYHGTEALVYVIDSSNMEDMAEVRSDLDTLLGDRDLQHLPLLIVLSKLDVSDCSCISKVQRQLSDLLDRQYSFAEVSIDNPQSYKEALQKLNQLLIT